MNWNKLVRWAGVAAFSTIVPAAAMAKSHHTRLTHPTTAPSSLTTRHSKTTTGRKAVASKLTTRGVKAKQLKTTRHKAVALKSKKVKASKLVGRKHTYSKLTAKKHVASKLMSSKAKAHVLTSHKAKVKPAIKTVTPVAPTM